MRVVLILALLLCFANGLSAQQITAETKSGYSSEVEFLDVVDDSLKFKNASGKTLTLPLKNFEKETLIAIIIQNETRRGTYGPKFLLSKKQEEDAFDLDPELKDIQRLQIGRDEDSYKLLGVLGATSRKLIILEKKRYEGFPGVDLEEASYVWEVDTLPLSGFDEPSLILIATRFIKATEEREKAAEMAKQAKQESENQMQERLAAQKQSNEQIQERLKSLFGEDDNFIPKKRFDHCTVTISIETFMQRGPGEQLGQGTVKTKKTRTLSTDDGGAIDIGTHFMRELDPNPGWLDQLGSNGWEMVRLERTKIPDGERSEYWFKREK